MTKQRPKQRLVDWLTMAGTTALVAWATYQGLMMMAAQQ